MYEALDVVSRELVGIIPACTINATANGVAEGQSLRIPVTPSNSAEDLVASGSAPTANFQNIDNVEVKINKIRRSKISWTGEEQLGLGGLASPIMRDQYVQMMRTLVNEMEKDCGEEIAKSALLAGNYVGTAGSTPFATNLDTLTEARKKLADNGAPLTDLQLGMNTTAGMKMRNLTQLQKVNESGTGDLLRQGVLGNLFGFNIRESAGLIDMKPAVATDYLCNGISAKDAKVVTVDTGVGAIKAGTLVSFGSDTNVYVVAEDLPTGGTSLKLTEGLKKATADNDAVVLKSNTPTVGFSRGSVILATRLPAVPMGGDLAIDRTVITDPVSGISFEVALWGGAYQNTITIATAWGVKTIKPEHAVAILG